MVRNADFRQICTSLVLNIPVFQMITIRKNIWILDIWFSDIYCALNALLIKFLGVKQLPITMLQNLTVLI